MGVRIVGAGFGDLAEGGDCSDGVSLSLQGEAELSLGFGQIRLKFDGGLQFVDGIIGVPSVG